MPETTKIVPVILSDNSKIFIEVVDTGQTGESQEREVFGNKTASFSELKSSITGISKELLEVVKDIAPSKASIEFGVEIGFETSGLTAVIVKGTSKANLKITLEWES